MYCRARLSVSPAPEEPRSRLKQTMVGDTSSRISSGRPCQIALGIALFLFGALLTLTACATERDVPVDPFAQYRPAVRQAFQSDFDLMADAPR